MCGETGQFFTGKVKGNLPETRAVYRAPHKASIQSSNLMDAYASVFVTALRSRKSQINLSDLSDVLMRNMGETHEELVGSMIPRSNMASICALMRCLVSGCVQNGWVLTGVASPTSMV